MEADVGPDDPGSPVDQSLFYGFSPLAQHMESPCNSTHASSQGQASTPITSSTRRSGETQQHPVSPRSTRSSFSAMNHPPTAVTRIRLYDQSHPGPYTVFIREIDVKLAPYKFSKYLNETYKSIINMQRSQGKVRIQFGSWKEANAMTTNSRFAGFNVSIPADKVEVYGAIRYEDLCDLNDLQALVDDGKGIWGNSQLPPCNIIHAELISRPDPDCATRRIPSNTIKLTFAGQVLPTQIIIEGLRVRVRPFHMKPMFCETCQTFGHTLKYCRRKPFCSECHEEHLTSDCTKAKERCTYCKAPEFHDRFNCAFFNQVRKDYQTKESNRRKTRYQHAVAASKAANHVPAPPLEAASHFPALGNNFATLPIDETEPACPATPSSSNPTRRLTNPYAQVVKNAMKPAPVQPRTAVKRPRSASTIQSSAASPPIEPHGKRASNAVPRAGSPAVAALKVAIIALVRKANVAEQWLPIIEAIIEPLLQALFSQLPVLFGALSPSVLSSLTA